MQIANTLPMPSVDGICEIGRDAQRREPVCITNVLCGHTGLHDGSGLDALALQHMQATSAIDIAVRPGAFSPPVSPHAMLQ